MCLNGLAALCLLEGADEGAPVEGAGAKRAAIDCYREALAMEAR